MDAIILCGGFGMRFPMSPERPKALLEINGKPLVEHITGKMAAAGVERIYISTNKRFASDFERWLSTQRDGSIEIVVENASSQGEKLGAIGALRFVIESKRISGDLMVINGDNAFDDRLDRALDVFRHESCAVLGTYTAKTTDEAKPFGVVEINARGEITAFEEKPENPKSKTISTGIYIFPSKTAARIGEYLDSGMSPDQPGNFLQWLHKRERIVGVMLKGGWFDVGNEEAYEKAKAALEAD